MFNIAVQTGDLDYAYGIEEAYHLIKEAGFDAVDANVDHLQSGAHIQAKIFDPAFDEALTEKEMLEYFRPFRDSARKYGLQNYQAHAPFPSMLTSEVDEVWDKKLMDMLKKTIVGCASIECQNLVIHPFFRDYDHQLSPEDEFNLNIDRYSQLAGTAKKYGVRICLENMFVGHKGKLYAACCNDPTLAACYVDTLNAKAGADCFGFCLDTGHALVAGQDIKKFMTIMGERIVCFHVHDNNGAEDNHQAPYTGKMDWNRFMEGLKEIHFDRTLSFETFNACRTVDPELIPNTLSYIAACGRMFSRRSE